MVAKSGPLLGVRVVDLSMALMGPYCTQILADLGADVIKVEGPTGDTTRFIPPSQETDKGAMFLNLNRGKRSVQLDLKRPEGRAALLRIVATSDVFIHSMRPRAIERLGLIYNSVAAIKPSIIYLNLWGFGRTGPYADWPAYDDVIQAASGLAMLQAHLNGGHPAYLSTVLADKVTGMTGLYSVIAALFHRERTGQGQEVEVSMFESMTAFVMVEHLCGSLFQPPLGPPTYPRVISPMRRPYQTNDGYVSVMIYNDKHWRRFFEALGSPSWSRDPMFANLRSRTEHIHDVYGKLGEVIAEGSTAEWMDLFRRAEIPAMPLFTTEDLLKDPHLERVGFWEERQTDSGLLRFPGIPTRFSASPGSITEAAPSLGEHTAEVLREVGLTEIEIANLKEPAGCASTGAADI